MALVCHRLPCVLMMLVLHAAPQVACQRTQLFELRSDESESINIANQEASLKRQMKALLRSQTLSPAAKKKSALIKGYSGHQTAWAECGGSVRRTLQNVPRDSFLAEESPGGRQAARRLALIFPSKRTQVLPMDPGRFR